VIVKIIFATASLTITGLIAATLITPSFASVQTQVDPWNNRLGSSKSEKKSKDKEDDSSGSSIGGLLRPGIVVVQPKKNPTSSNKSQFKPRACKKVGRVTIC
jgi:hypothetical protein